MSNIKNMPRTTFCSHTTMVNTYTKNGNPKPLRPFCEKQRVYQHQCYAASLHGLTKRSPDTEQKPCKM